MADQNEAKTKTIGFLPIEKVQTLNGWEEYVVSGWCPGLLTTSRRTNSRISSTGSVSIDWFRSCSAVLRVLSNVMA